MPLRRAVNAALFAFVALAACSERTAAPYETPSVDLLTILDEAEVVCPSLDRLTTGAPPDPRYRLVDDGFDDGVPDGWHGEETPTGRDPADGRSVAFVNASGGRLVRYVTRTTGAMHVVTARVRAFGTGDGERPGVWVRSLARAPRSGELRRDGAKELIDGAGPWRTAEIAREGGQTWRDVALLFPAEPARHALEIALVGGDVGLLVDEVRVRRVDAVERAALLDPARPVAQGLLGSRVVIHDERRDALLLPGGSSAAFAVRVPDHRPRLDVTTTLLPGANGAPTLRVRIDGDEVATRTESPRPFVETRFRPWVVPLDRYAGRDVRLTLEVDGSPLDDVAWGTPWVLGTPATRPGPNLVLVSLDTLRADMVGACGGDGGLTPHLDAFAARGTAFARALTVGAYTLPSHATMMTGQHPLEHGVRKPPARLDPTRSPLLAPRLAARGWQAAAYTGGGFVDPRFGFDAGFSIYSTADPGLGTDRRHASIRDTHVLDEPTAASTARLEVALDRLARRDDQPFFLFLHTYVVHNYLPHRAYLERPEVHPELAELPVDELYRRATEELDEAAAGRLAWLYRATVRQADDLFVRPLLERLDALGLADQTVVAVVSDHGEQFLEHGGFAHFGYPWAENVQVPLLLRGPGVPVGEVVRDAVTLQELAPTLAALLGVEPDPRVTGWPLLGDGAAGPPERDILLEHPVHWSAYVHGDWKLVRHVAEDDAETLRLFRFDRDPRDAHDLAAERPDVVRRMAERLAKRSATLRASGLGAPAPDDGALDAEIEARLRELGYLGEH